MIKQGISLDITTEPHHYSLKFLEICSGPGGFPSELTVGFRVSDGGETCSLCYLTTPEHYVNKEKRIIEVRNAQSHSKGLARVFLPNNGHDFSEFLVPIEDLVER